MATLELYAFNCLEKYEQFEYLWNSGTFMASRKENNYIIGLYDLHYFYVEVLYDSVSNAINGLRSFKSLDLIEPYFERYVMEVKKWLK